MYILRTGRGDYLFGWMSGYPILCSDREDALRVSEEMLNETILTLTQAGYAVTALPVA